jgi:hypothetical protein
MKSINPNLKDQWIFSVVLCETSVDLCVIKKE